MKYIFIIICLFVVFKTYSQRNGEFLEYFENGKIKSIENYIDDKENGEQKEFYENGKLRKYRFYLNGKLNGEQKDFYINENLQLLENWKNGKKNGEWKSYFENGKLSGTGNYYEDWKDGEWKYYYENGKIMKLENYKASSTFELNNKSNENDKIFTKLDVDASYPGGEGSWRRYLSNNLNLDVAKNEGAPSGIYTVIVRFIVAKDGSISDVVPETSHGYGMEQESVRAIKKSGKWTPAIENGRNVTAYKRQPITFIVN